MTSINQSYLKDHRGEEQLKGRIGVGAREFLAHFSGCLNVSRDGEEV